jgi:hypothetical protein
MIAYRDDPSQMCSDLFSRKREKLMQKRKTAPTREGGGSRGGGRRSLSREDGGGGGEGGGGEGGGGCCGCWEVVRGARSLPRRTGGGRWWVSRERGERATDEEVEALEVVELLEVVVEGARGFVIIFPGSEGSLFFF